MVTIVENGRRLRILVAEDEASVRTMLGEMLTDLGHEVMTVENGTEALKCLATERVELVLTDLDMPGANGWDVIDGAKARDPELPVVLVTGWGPKVAATDRNPRPDAVLAKPVRVPCLEKVIARVTEAA